MPLQRYLVRVSESAFMQMTLATIAAYDVPKQSPGHGNSAMYNETYGLLWGHQIKSPQGTCIFAIEHTTIDGHAKNAHSWVLPQPEYRAKLCEIIPAFWPSAQLIGEFHSHPYKPGKSFPATPGLSSGDLNAIEIVETDELVRAGVRVFLVMSIQGLKKTAWANPKHHPPNLLQWRMGRYKLALTAYVAEEKRRAKRKGPELLIVPRHYGWEKYSQAHSPYKGIVTVSAPTGAGLKSFADFW